MSREASASEKASPRLFRRGDPLLDYYYYYYYRFYSFLHAEGTSYTECLQRHTVRCLPLVCTRYTRENRLVWGGGNKSPAPRRDEGGSVQGKNREGKETRRRDTESKKARFGSPERRNQDEGIEYAIPDARRRQPRNLLKTGNDTKE